LETSFRRASAYAFYCYVFDLTSRIAHCIWVNMSIYRPEEKVRSTEVYINFTQVDNSLY